MESAISVRTRANSCRIAGAIVKLANAFAGRERPSPLPSFNPEEKKSKRDAIARIKMVR